MKKDSRSETEKEPAVFALCRGRQFKDKEYTMKSLILAQDER
jgi:hypothetical protein